MKQNFSLQLLLGAGLALVPLTGVKAQPDPNNAPKGQNPNNWGNNRANFQALFNGRPLTPEQIKQMQVLAGERKVLSLRQQLTQAGFTDTTVQDAIVAYYKDKEAARTKLQAQWQTVSKAIRQPNTTDAQLAAQLNDFQAAADQEKERRNAAFKDLSAKIGLAQKPRLQALLMTMGLASDETSLLQQDNFNGFGTAIPGLGGLFNVLGGDVFGGNMTGGNFLDGNVILGGNALGALQIPVVPAVPAPPADGKAKLQALNIV